MPALTNTTPYGVALEVSCDRHGRPCLLAVVAAAFHLPRVGVTAGGPLARCEEQAAPALQDEYYGEPARTSLRREGQSCHARPGTDIYLRGYAWAPGGRACREARLHLEVGGRSVEARLSGARRWQRGPLGVVASRPEPFERVALRYEACVGGSDEPRNPVGCGVHRDERRALDQELPQIEDPQQLLRTHAERPAPVGLGPIGRWWTPRVGFAGTYDDKWREERAPLWPLDLDNRFFHAAHPSLVARPHLGGGEAVRLIGGHPDGEWRFALPTLRLKATTYYANLTRDVRDLRLDAVDVDTETRTLTLVLRTAIPTPGGLFRHVSTRLCEEVAAS